MQIWKFGIIIVGVEIIIFKSKKVIAVFFWGEIGSKILKIYIYILLFISIKIHSTMLDCTVFKLLPHNWWYVIMIVYNIDIEFFGYKQTRVLQTMRFWLCTKRQ